MRKLIAIIVASIISVVVFQNCSADFVVAKFDLSSVALSVNSAKMRRVSNQEYKNSLLDIIEQQLARRPQVTGPDRNWYWTPGAVQGPLSELPVDTLATKLGTDQLASSLSTARFTAYLDTAYAFGKLLSTDNTLRAKFIGACATTPDDVSNATCVDTFITEFATLAFRTPPTAGERAELKANIPNWRTLIARILVHPRFLLHFDRDGAQDSDGNYLLTDYELEARLSSVFWKSAPDVDGLANVASGKLKTAAGRQAEVARILSSQKAHDALWIFYQQWLATSRLPVNGAYDSGLGWEGLAAPLTSAQIENNFKNAVIEDSHQYLEYLTWTTPSSLETLFRSPLIFTTNTTLAGIYGVTPRANTSAAPVTDPTGHYSGILSRAMITQQKPSVNGDINHIQRGVFILTNLLNIELGQPANFADQQQAQLVIPESASTRTIVQTKTGQGSCIGCHTTINPAGYALANFDSLGRYVTTELRFRDNYAGGSVQIASNPVDATATLPLNGAAYSVNSVTTLTDAMFTSGRIYQGFATYYFEYAFGRVPSSGADQKIIAAIVANLKSTTVRGALEAVAALPEFAKVTMGQ